MRRVVVLVAALALGGCETADQRFEKSFALTQGAGEACRVATEAVEHFLRNADQVRLRKWRDRASTPCRLARLGA